MDRLLIDALDAGYRICLEGITPDVQYMYRRLKGKLPDNPASVTDRQYVDPQGYLLPRLFVHNSNHARDIFENGFSRAYAKEDNISQSYGKETGHGSIVAAFDIDNAYCRDSMYPSGELVRDEDDDSAPCNIYLPYCNVQPKTFTRDMGSVVFMSSGFQVYHSGDEEYQAFVDCKDVPGALFVTNTAYEHPELLNEEFGTSHELSTRERVDIKDDVEKDPSQWSKGDDGVWRNPTQIEEFDGVQWRVIGKRGDSDKILVDGIENYEYALRWIKTNWKYASKFLSQWNKESKTIEAT